LKKNKAIALEARLRECRNVLTLGVKTNFNDYSQSERMLIKTAKKIYYPTVFYADLFNAVGIATFPSYHTYNYVQDKIKQTALFAVADIPHPETRTFYGKRIKENIPKYFGFPYIAKIPRGSAMGRGVYLIKNKEELDSYLSLTKVAYIQRYLPIKRDMRIVFIGDRAVHSYFRVAPEDDFRTNVSVGGFISLEPVPEEAVRLAEYTAKKCGWDDVGIDICKYEGKYYVFEANMKYGKEGFRKAGIDYIKLMENLIEEKKI